MSKKLTLEKINDLIVAEYYNTADKLFEGCPIHSSLEVLTICVLVLKMVIQ